jgi:RNA polymerase sigma-70 factor (ECF subfamily)
VKAQSEQLADLLVRTGRADRLAFRQLYEATAPKIFGVILRIVRNRTTGEEVLQDVYLRLWQKAATYQPDAGPPMPWLNTIARRCAIDVMRRKTPEVTTSSGDGEDWLAQLSDGRDAETDITDRSSLQRCLSRLEPDLRTCIVLAYCEGRSREELAEQYARPANTIKTWLRRGLMSLKECLDTP